MQRETSAEEFEEEEGKAVEQGSEHAKQRPVAIEK